MPPPKRGIFKEVIGRELSCYRKTNCCRSDKLFAEEIQTRTTQLLNVHQANRLVSNQNANNSAKHVRILALIGALHGQPR